jgi:two-component system chemotaxis response regulator CheB
MRTIRVVVTDDSAVIRRLICNVIDAEDDMTVVGIAENGRVAVARARELRPDVMTLDVEMPEMNGLEALAVIRKSHPSIPVVMFSTLTVAGGHATLDALSLGAADFVTKPSGTDGLAAAIGRIRAELVPKLRELGSAARTARVLPAPRPATGRPARSINSRVDCIVIGISTGGPRALEALVPNIPAAFPVPILAVQHMPPVFTALLAERLDRTSSIRVSEAVQGDVIEAGHLYIAPGGHHLVVGGPRSGALLALSDAPPVNSCRPAVDVLFRSAVERWGGHILGVVMTGMGADGAAGARAIVDAGGRVVVQDRATSVVWGMPGAVAHAGLADRELALADIAGEIVRSVDIGRTGASSQPLSRGVR